MHFVRVAAFLVATSMATTAPVFAQERAQELAPIKDTGKPAQEASVWNWVLAGTLGVAGVLVLVSPMRTLVSHGAPIDVAANGQPQSQVYFGASGYALMGAGALLLSSAAFVAIWQPFKTDVRVSANPNAMTLQWSGRF